MKNSLNRFVPDGYKPFVGSDEYKKQERRLVKEKKTSNGFTELKDVSDLFDKLNITDGMTLSFHHHLRNGDFVLNMVAEEYQTCAVFDFSQQQNIGGTDRKRKRNGYFYGLRKRSRCPGDKRRQIERNVRNAYSWRTPAGNRKR